MGTRIPRSNIDNYYLAREREGERVPWVRVGDFAHLDLPRPVVVVNGAFDLLHSGHMKILFAARQRGGTVVVGLDSDLRVGRKGVGRPVQSFIERATTLGFMPVDYIVEIERDQDMKALLRATTADLRVQGFDHKGVPSKFPEYTKCFVRNGSMRTSKIIERCKGIL